MAKSPPQPSYAAEGDWGCVEFALRSNGKYEAEEFLESLIDHPDLRGKGQNAHDKFARAFQQMANAGGGLKKERFSPESGLIYGFKYELFNKLMRFGCFQNGNCWILTHGFMKKGAQKGKGKWSQEDIDRAQQIMAEHLSIFGKAK